MLLELLDEQLLEEDELLDELLESEDSSFYDLDRGSVSYLFFRTFNCF